MINYKRITEEVIQLVRSTGEMLIEMRKNISGDDVEAKGKNNFVTRFDKLSEERIVTKLKALLPESGFIAEEGTSVEKGDVFNWFIDPIDGTTNFMHGAPPFSISVALQQNNEMVIGVVYEMHSQECFYSYKGAGVFVNDVEVKCSSTKTVADSLIATGFPYTDFGRMQRFVNSLTYFMENSHGLRRLGSAAVDLAYVACGRYDAFYEYGLQPYDVAAGAFLVQQAGGFACDFNGGNNFLFGQEIIASNANVYSELKSAINKLMNE